MKQPQSNVQRFTSDWAKVKSWAATNKIPQVAVDNVQVLDQGRLDQGYYAMSNSERTRSILAAAGMDYNTALPTDNPNPSNIIGNTINNARNIFTGLMPTRLVQNIWDTVKTTWDDATDPARLAHAKGGALASLLTDTALSWIPGAADVGTVLKAGSLEKGFETLLENPISSVLDVMPAVKWADLAAGKVAAESAAGDALAARVGMNKAGLAHMGAVRMAGKAVGAIRIPGSVGEHLNLATGESSIGPVTLAERASQAANAHGLGRNLAQAAHGLMSITNQYTHQYRMIRRDLVRKVSKLSKDTIDRTTGAVTQEGELSTFTRVMHSGRSISDLLADDTIPTKVKEAIHAYEPWEVWHQERMLASGKLLPLTTVAADGTRVTDLYEADAQVWKYRDTADALMEKAEKANEVPDRLSAQAAQINQLLTGFQSRIDEIATNLLNFATRAGNPPQYVPFFGRLAGRDGPLEAMKRALASGDWEAYRAAANRADQVMNMRAVKGAPEVSTTRPGSVGGRPMTLVRDVTNLAVGYSRIPPGHFRAFRAEGSQVWHTDMRAVARENPATRIYKTDVKFDSAGITIAPWLQRDIRRIQTTPGSLGLADPGKLDHQLNLGPIKEISSVRTPAVPGWDQIPQLRELKGLIGHAAALGRAKGKVQRQYRTAAAKAAPLNAHAAAAVDRFIREVHDRPPSIYRDVVTREFFKNFLASDRAEQLLDASAKWLKGQGMAEDVVDRIRSNPQRLYELVVAVAGPMFSDPFIPDMTKEDHALFMQSALDEVSSLRARGYKPMYVPTVGGKFAGSRQLGGDRIFINPLRAPTISAAKARTFDMSSTVFDVMLGVDKATSEIMGKDATLEFQAEVLRPMLRTGSQLRRVVAAFHGIQLETDVSATPAAVLDSLIQDQYGLVRFNAKELTGLEERDLGLDPEETYYIPKIIQDQVSHMVGKDQFPLHGAWDKATGVFRYAILGLSPRYTAHILFGGTMLLALRIDPGSFLFIGHAAKAVRAYHRGEEEHLIPPSVFQGAAQRGSPDVEVHFRGGRQMGKWTVEQRLEKWGLNPKLATMADWMRAAADVNFRFTNYVSDMQRAIAYLDGVKHAERHRWIYDPTTGERVPMTADRAHFEGMRAAEKVMGNLQAMTPFERAVARKIMPFYGWTKHILSYVLTYPVDHPWRTSFLSTLATQNSADWSTGLDERMQLLLFLGKPDVMGNVSAIDIRALDPFRDTANYATLAGWISSLNPIITAPFAAIDPNIIFGNNVIHPTISYNAFYGSNEAVPSGGMLAAAEQEIPELTAVDYALGLSANARSIRARGGTAYAKGVFEALGIPFAQVQHLNLQQIAAKHEIDRYNQAKTDAANAWATGDFSTLFEYPSTVPDPRQTGYNITPAELYKQYQQAVKRYPGLPPSESLPSLPAPAL